MNAATWMQYEQIGMTISAAGVVAIVWLLSNWLKVYARYVFELRMIVIEKQQELGKIHNL